MKQNDEPTIIFPKIIFKFWVMKIFYDVSMLTQYSCCIRCTLRKIEIFVTSYIWVMIDFEGRHCIYMILTCKFFFLTITLAFWDYASILWNAGFWSIRYFMFLETLFHAVYIMHLHYIMSRFNANMRWCALNALFVQQTDDFTILYLMVNPGKKMRAN